MNLFVVVEYGKKNIIQIYIYKLYLDILVNELLVVLSR